MIVWLTLLLIGSVDACQFHGKYGEWHPDGGIAEIFRQPPAEPKAKEKKASKKAEKPTPPPVIYGPPTPATT